MNVNFGCSQDGSAAPASRLSVVTFDLPRPLYIRRQVYGYGGAEMEKIPTRWIWTAQG